MKTVRVVFDLPVRKSFSYTIPEKEEVLPGQRVLAPFGPRKLLGWVVANEEEGEEIPLRPILKIVDKDPLFSPPLLALCQWVSSYYGASLGSVFGAVSGGLSHSCIPSVPLEKSFISSSTPNDIIPDLIEFSSLKEKIDFLQSLVSKRSSGSILILFSHISHCIDIFQQLHSQYNDCLLLFTGDLTKSIKTQHWVRMRSQKNLIVLGTRIAAFSPLSDIKTIIVDEPDHFGHKENSSPRYETKEVAWHLAKLFSSSLLFLSLQRDLSLHIAAEKKHITFTTFLSRPLPKTVVLHFRKREKKSLFHQDSLHFFEKTLFSGGRAAIIHARKGYARFLACATCGSRLLCPECETPLLAQTSKVLFCSHDRKTFPLPSSCSECGGKKWRYSMEGIEKYNEFLNRQYPSFRIVSFESHFSKPPSCDILLGTIGMEEILSQFSPGILLIPDGDSFVARAGFKSEERFFLAIQRMRKRLPENALVFIQSSNNEIALFHALTKDNPEIFYTSEGRIRKKLHFPPFSHFLKIIPGRKIGKEKEELLESFIPSLGDIYDASFSRGAKKAFLLKTDFPQKHIEEIISFCDRKKIPVSFDVDPYE